MRDQCLFIDVSVDDDDIVQTIFDGLPSPWETFMSNINGRKAHPDFEMLWHD